MEELYQKKTDILTEIYNVNNKLNNLNNKLENTIKQI